MRQVRRAKREWHRELEDEEGSSSGEPESSEENMSDMEDDERIEAGSIHKGFDGKKI